MSFLPTDKRSRLLIGISVLFVVFVVFAFISRQTSPEKAIIKKDRDTGEILITEPNKTPEKFNQSEEIIVLGSPALLERGLTTNQFQLFRSNLVAYVKKNFPEYDRVKILPNELIGGGNKIQGTLRLGESDNKLTFTIQAFDLRFIEVTVHDPTNRVQDLQTGRLEATPASEEDEDTNL